MKKTPKIIEIKLITPQRVYLFQFQTNTYILNAKRAVLYVLQTREMNYTWKRVEDVIPHSVYFDYLLKSVKSKGCCDETKTIGHYFKNGDQFMIEKK